MDFKSSGMDNVEQELKALADGLASLDMATLARKGAAIAQRLAPKDTGKLAASISPITRSGYASIQVGVSYARFVLGPQWKRRIDDLMNARAEVEQEIDRLTE